MKTTQPNRRKNQESLLKEILAKRIMFLDGAMGSMIQTYNLTESDFRGEQFKDHPVDLTGNNDILNLTRPDVIKDIHYAFLEAGSDILETNTFNGTVLSQREYKTEEFTYEINRAAAANARRACDEYEQAHPGTIRFTAGSIGPTSKTLSLSPNVNEPAYRDVTFNQMADAYEEAVHGLVDGGSDIIIIETIFDTLNAKAAIFAVQRFFKKEKLTLPIMISGTLSDASGRMLSGQRSDAFYHSVAHCNPLSVGLNCALGAADLHQYIKVISGVADRAVSAYPNAGLPDEAGHYTENPQMMAKVVKAFAEQGDVNILGGCCGTTPPHIKAIVTAVKDLPPRVIPAKSKGITSFSGLEPLNISKDSPFINVGERTNVAGSRKFARLIKEKKYDEAIRIARDQVENGAHIVDVNLDDAMLQAKEEMVHFLNLLVSEPEISRVPIMVDSSEWAVIEAGLQCLQGKSVVNSISLKEGEALFLEKAEKIKAYGAGVVVMAFDEKGQADTFERKVEICSRSYELITDKNGPGFNPEDIIFDVNVFAVATGMEEHRNFGVDFIEAVKFLSNKYPGTRYSGGISNLSFSFRGNNPVREAMHSIFLHYGHQVGLTMGIVNPAQLANYYDIPIKLRDAAEDVIFNRKEDADEILLEIAGEYAGKKGTVKANKTDMAWRENSLQERVIYGLLHGRDDFIADDVDQLRESGLDPIDIIQTILMGGMDEIGVLFGEGKMFLPQVVKSARVMKKAVDVLQPYMEQDKNDSLAGKKFLLATVKGDVHDIGKNIVGLVLQCNGYDVIDMGVMVECDDIIAAAVKNNVDYLGLSGLITPSLIEMERVAAAMEKQGLTIPIIVGGATTSNLHTSIKIAPNYSGCVIHTGDAAVIPGVLEKLSNPEKKNAFIKQLKEDQESLRKTKAQSDEKNRVELVPFDQLQKKVGKEQG